ncbi:MAG: rod shape-determining protein RodA [Clostridia bacterium]|nr:rod shape-determining protein RodA [Clostridia bacterium]
MMTSDTRKRNIGHFDWQLLAVVYLMSIFGIFCISSATYDPDMEANVSLLNRILNSRSSMWQSIFVLVSPIVLVVVISIPLDLYRNRLGRLIYLGVLGLLIITLVTATLVNGIKAWLNTGFGRAIQPAEFSKIAVLLALARVLSRSEKPLNNFKDFMRAMLVIGLPSVIVLAQSETGSVIVIVVMSVCMLYFGGVDIRLVLGLVLFGMTGIGLIIAYALLSGSTDYRILRLVAFTNPRLYSESGGYQLLNSQKAIGSGQMTGNGVFTLGTVTQLGGVPENSTDFIFSTIGEAFGFVGTAAVLGAYLFLILRMLYLARYTQDKYGKMIIVGVMSMLFFHVFENISMCIGLMPITGIPLPFLSYGGSNYMTNIIGIGLVLNVTRSRTGASDALYSVDQGKSYSFAPRHRKRGKALF